MLLTSRETRRWIIPKGWLKKALSSAEVAELEAFEEAGVIGRLATGQPFGRYTYKKKMPGKVVVCAVEVYLLLVERQSDDWPERLERETKWFSAEEAAALVKEEGLAEVIRLFAEADAETSSLQAWRMSPVPHLAQGISALP